MLETGKNLGSLGLILMFGVVPGAVAQELPAQKAIVEVESVKKSGVMELQFKVKPADGMLLTFEAPWSLKLEAVEGVKSEKTRFSKKDMSESLPGFTVETRPVSGSKSGKVDYKIVTFACTKDKKQCFRESHQQSYTFSP